MTENADPAEIFRQEAADLLDQLEQALLDLNDDPDNRDLINTAFRALHTIKGSGAMFGFEEVAAFAHEFESAFDRVRKGDVPSGPDLIAIALSAKDFIRSQIEKPDEAEAVIGVCILSDLRRLVAPSDGAASGQYLDSKLNSSETDAAESSTYRVRIRFNKDILINGTNPLLLLAELRALGDCDVVCHTEAVPPLAAIEPSASYLHWDVVLKTHHPQSAIDDVFIFVQDEMSLHVELIARHASRKSRDDTLLNVDVVAKSERRGQNSAVHEPASKVTHAAQAGKESSTIRVQAERLDEMMDRVGELVIAQARLTQLASSTGTKGVAEEIERLTSSLRDAMMGIRMVPIGSLFGRFRRLVHDLSRDLVKEIELITEGEETELDKTMIERLADPLVHVIRNAADHGLEDTKTRIAAGKTPAGTIRLVARHTGAEVQICVEDDGRGLNAERIRKKAEEQGLITPDAVLSDSELHQLIFQPGFSTAKEVSAFSGRGVGMDVVKRTIEGMRGSIDLVSEPGRGSQITLRLPLTLAIIEGLLVRVADTRYVIPLTAVEECVELSSAEGKGSKGRSFLNIRGDLVPFLRLRELFDEPGEGDVHQKVVIVSTGDSRVGLVVDQIIGSHQTVIKSLSKLHAHVPAFSGATILGDGTVALILDILHLVEVGQTREAKLQTSTLELV